MIGFWLSAAGLAVGAGMGLFAMINPRWAARLVRLRDDPEKPGGFAEFRGTYGGLFFASHALGLWLLSASERWSANQYLAAAAAGAIAVCGVMWLGTALGRLISMAADGAATRFNAGSAVFECVLGLAIACPAPFLIIPL